MLKRYAVTDARANLPTIVNEVEAGNQIELTRRGKPVAVVISGREYARLRSERPHFADAYRIFLTRVRLRKIDAESDAFDGLRDTGTGRKVNL